jgi:hypothetical protein
MVAFVNQPYSGEPEPIRVSGRCAIVAPYVRPIGGDLPPGLTIDARGAWRGMPTEPGRFSVLVEVSDGCARRREVRSIEVLPAPVLTVEADRLAYKIFQGAPPFDASLVRVSSSAPGIAYAVEAIDAPWVRFEQREGAIPADGRALEADTVRLRIDASKLPSGDHKARVRFTTWRGANAPELTVALHVAPAVSALPAAEPRPIAITPPAISFVEIAEPVRITPPEVTIPPAPHFPKAPPKVVRKPGQGGPVRSRVLPIPKVVLPPPKPAAKEPPPERTKPSAMPPAAAEKKAAH